MSFNHHHHHHQPRPYVQEDYCGEVYESERVYAAPPPAPYPSSECGYERVNSGYYERPVHHNSGGNYQRNERLGELGALASGAFALYEGHRAKTDPEHASKHKIEEGVGALGALSSAGYAYYEHNQKNKFKDGCW